MARIAALALAAALASGAVAAAPTFGPQTFERTSGAPDVYVETVDVPIPGEYALVVRNGDGEGGRATEVSISLADAPLVAPGDLGADDPGLRRAVELAAGPAELRVELGGEPGSFVTVALLPRGDVPGFVHGRLVLPWGRHDDEIGLALALKNGSTRRPRALRVIFFAPSGEPLAASPRLILPPRGSLLLPVGPIVDGSGWERGSVEVYYAGDGPARVFGDARSFAPAAGEAEVVPLQQAGHAVFTGRPDGPPPGRLDR